MNEAEEIRESNQQWVDWARRRCGALATADVRELPGWAIAWGGADVALYNTVLLSTAISGREDLKRRMETLRGFLAAKGSHEPPLIAICLDFVAEGLRAQMEQSMRGLGLRPTMRSQGMAADRLDAASRALPEIECRRVADEETRNALADVNSIVHRFPIDTGRKTMAQSGALDGDFFGFVGYVDGVAAATSVAIPLNGCLHILRVATLPEYRRQGYGEAVMRRSIEAAAAATGISRTTLHTTKAGFEMYLRMGYRVVAEFEGWG